MEIILEHLKGERAGSLDRIACDVIRVGRSAEFELFFDDLGVSFEHAELRLRDGDFWLVDRGSTNGSFVNEERAYNARLKEGDVVRFGKKGPIVRVRLQARPGDPPARTGPGVAPRDLAADLEKARSSESLPDLPPLAPALPAAPLPALPERKRRATIPSMPALVEPPAIIAAGTSDAASSASSSGSESESGQRAGERRLIIGTARTPTWIYWSLSFLSIVTVGAAATALALWLDLERKSTFALAETRRADQLRRDLDELRRAVHDREREDQKASVRSRDETRAIVERLEQSLEHERREARRIEREGRARIEELEQALARAKGELAQLAHNADGRGTGDNKAWKAVQKRVQGSIVLVATTFNMKRKDGSIEPFTAFGSGFFLTRDGYVCTNKHVVEPWKFKPLAVRLATEDIEIDHSSYAVTIWVAGQRFKNGQQLDPSQGYSSARHTLARVRAGPDRWAQFSVPNAPGIRFVQLHGDTNDDLAILKATGGPFEPATLRSTKEGPVEKLDQVMVLGFPAGAQILEKGIAETSPSLGLVRKVEDTIYTSAPIIGGNSGGPLLDTEGRVVGVATRVIQGGDNLGICIKVEHVVSLLEGGSW